MGRKSNAQKAIEALHAAQEIVHAAPKIESDTNTICIIPARAGSKRIPNKNFRIFYGRPIIEYSLYLAQSLKYLSKIIVSTDVIETPFNWEDNYAKLDDRFVWLERSACNSGDDATLRQVVLEVLQKYKAEKILILYPCAPFAKRGDIDAGYAMMDTAYNTAFPVMEANTEFNKFLTVKPGMEHLIFPCFPDHNQDFRQIKRKFGKIYEHAGQWFWIKRSHIESNEIISGSCGYVMVDPMEAQDINTEYDWKIAEWKYKSFKNKIIGSI